MEFEFKINKYYLVGHTMTSKNKPFSAWNKLEERIWQKYKNEPAYYFLNSKYISLAIERIQSEFIDNNIKNVFLKNTTVLKKIYIEIFKAPEFKRLLNETDRHLLKIKNQWNTNEKEALKILQEISGLPLPTKNITVYITHPKSGNGKTLNKKTIVCGHKEKWKK